MTPRIDSASVLSRDHFLACPLSGLWLGRKIKVVTGVGLIPVQKETDKGIDTFSLCVGFGKGIEGGGRMVCVLVPIVPCCLPVSLSQVRRSQTDSEVRQ